MTDDHIVMKVLVAESSRDLEVLGSVTFLFKIFVHLVTREFNLDELMKRVARVESASAESPAPHWHCGSTSSRNFASRQRTGRAQLIVSLYSIRGATLSIVIPGE